MCFQRLFIRYVLCFFAFIFIISSILLIAHSSNTDLLYSKFEISKLNNLQEFTFCQISCDVIFDIYKYGFCMDTPSFYYYQSPMIYDKIIYYFNILPNINYTKIRTCQIDDMVLYINKLDKQYIDMFWIIS